MRGTKQIRVSNRILQYRFAVNRNITVVTGNSGTGKTTLYDLIAEHTRLGESSGVRIKADAPCIALTDIDWLNQLRRTSGSIIFVDEGFEPLPTHEFAAAIKATDNYYVLFTREPLYELPYSVDEIYEIRTSGKYHTFQRLYQRSEDRLYALAADKLPAAHVLTEDSHAGYQFYQHYYDGSSVTCHSAGSNSGIFPWLRKHHDEGVLVIADGAAFGAEIGRVLELQRRFPDKITICLPESFEWLILQSGLLDIPGLQEMLDDPGRSIDSRQYFSWENFFEDYLVQQTAGTHYAYSKSQLHSFYTVRENSGRIVALIAAHMPKA